MVRRALQPYLLRPGGVLPGGLPERSEVFDVEALGVDGLRAQMHAELVRRGHRVRAVSFTPGGMVAYVEALS